MKRVFDAFNKAYKKILGRGPAWEAQQTTKKQLESDDTIKTFPIAYEDLSSLTPPLVVTEHTKYAQTASAL